MNKKKNFTRWATAGLIFVSGWGILAFTVYLLFAVVWAEKVWIALALGAAAAGLGFFLIFRGLVKLSECALRPKLELLPEEKLDDIVRDAGAHSMEKVHVAKDILAGRRAAIHTTTMDKASERSLFTEAARSDPDPQLQKIAPTKLHDPLAMAGREQLSGNAEQAGANQPPIAAAAQKTVTKNAVPDDYDGCVRMLKDLVAVADARRTKTFEECPEYEAIRGIGQRLHALGGLRLMQKAYAEVRERRIYFSQDWWDKIGQWRA